MGHKEWVTDSPRPSSSVYSVIAKSQLLIQEWVRRQETETQMKLRVVVCLWVILVLRGGDKEL